MVLSSEYYKNPEPKVIQKKRKKHTALLLTIAKVTCDFRTGPYLLKEQIGYCL
jgi:hypothetical protein